VPPRLPAPKGRRAPRRRPTTPPTDRSWEGRAGTSFRLRTARHPRPTSLASLATGPRRTMDPKAAAGGATRYLPLASSAHGRRDSGVTADPRNRSRADPAGYTAHGRMIPKDRRFSLGSHRRRLLDGFDSRQRGQSTYGTVDASSGSPTAASASWGIGSSPSRSTSHAARSANA